MRRWKQRALQAEARVAALKCEATEQEAKDEESAEHVSAMIAESEARVDGVYDALEQIRDTDHGHPRDSAGRRVPSQRCEVCRIVAEVGL